MNPTKTRRIVLSLLLAALLTPGVSAQTERQAGTWEAGGGMGMQTACAPSLDDMVNGGCIEASTTPTFGMLYPLSNNLFIDSVTGFTGLAITAPSDRLHVNGNIRLNDRGDGIVFSSSGSLLNPIDPMIRMFTSGSANADRMVIAHSTTFSEWGLEYLDVDDQFVFRRATAPVLTIDLDGAIVVEGDASNELRIEGGAVVHLLGGRSLLEESPGRSRPLTPTR